MTPFYYGHTFNNPKDLPFAVGMLASRAAIMACWQHLPRLPPRSWIGTGLIIGMTLGIRVGAVLNLVYFGLMRLAWLALKGPAHAHERTLSESSAVGALAKSLVKVVGLACSVMLPFWPYTLVDPARHIWRTVAVSTHFTDWIHPVRFAGADVLSNQLPWNYVPTGFGVTLPEFYFVAAGAGALQIPLVAQRPSAVVSSIAIAPCSGACLRWPFCARSPRSFWPTPFSTTVFGTSFSSRRRWPSHPACPCLRFGAEPHPAL